MAKSSPSVVDAGSDRERDGGLQQCLLWCFGQKNRTSCDSPSLLKHSLRVAFALSVWLFGSAHGDPTSLVSRTFYVSGVECGSCVYLVEQAVREVPGVSRVSMVQSLENCVDVIFDPNIVSEHQIALALFTAPALHGTPYRAVLRMRMPDCGRQEAKMTALFEQWKPWVELQVLDRIKGELAVHFLPLKTNTQKPEPQGWSVARFWEAFKEGLPEGTVLEFLGTGTVGG